MGTSLFVPKIFGLGDGGYRAPKAEDLINRSAFRKFINRAQHSRFLGNAALVWSGLWSVVTNLLYSWPLEKLVNSVMDFYEGKDLSSNALRIAGAIAGNVALVLVGTLVLTTAGATLAAFINLPGLVLMGSVAAGVALTLVGMAAGRFLVDTFKTLRNWYKHRNKEKLTDDSYKNSIELKELSKNGNVDPTAFEELKEYIAHKLEKHSFLGIANPLLNKHEKYKELEQAVADKDPAYIGRFLQAKLSKKEAKHEELEKAFNRNDDDFIENTFHEIQKDFMKIYKLYAKIFDQEKAIEYI